jgi:hypothetical protein
MKVFRLYKAFAVFEPFLARTNGTRKRSLAWSRVSRVVCLKNDCTQQYNYRDWRSVRQHTELETILSHMCVDAQTKASTWSSLRAFRQVIPSRGVNSATEYPTVCSVRR